MKLPSRILVGNPYQRTRGVARLDLDAIGMARVAGRYAFQHHAPASVALRVDVIRRSIGAGHGSDRQRDARRVDAILLSVDD
ncbi:hypothetical protein D3C85_1641920 [compost metagenome]